MNDLPPGLVGVPATRRMWTRTALALVRIQDQLPPGAAIGFQLGGCTVPTKRNSVVEALLDRPSAEWALFLDSDMNPPADVAHRLWRTAEEEDADLVQPMMVQKEPPHEPVGARVAERGEPADPLRPCTSDPAIRFKRYTAESLARVPGPFEIDAAGTGCLLVRRRVFEALEEPWFVAQEDGTGSDFNFTLRATLAGHRLVLDPRIEVGHVSCYSYGLGDAVRAEGAAERDARRRQIEAAAARRMDADSAARLQGVGP